jgi:hypothetical protein
MHNAGLKSIAIKTGEAHSQFMDTVFPYAFWTLLFVILVGLAVAIAVW